MDDNRQLYRHSKLLNIVEYIFGFLTIISNSIFVSSGSIGFFIKISWTFCLILLFVNAVLYLKYYNVNKLILFFFFFVSGILLFLIINYFVRPFNKKFIFALFVVPIMIITYFYYCLKINNNHTPLLFYKIENILLIMSIISLLFWVLSSIGISPNMSITTQFGANFDGSLVVGSIPGYFGIHFVPQGITPFLGMNLARNSGIFNEAPIYSAMLDMGLFIELFLRPKSKIFNFRILLFILTLITTTSTNGILVAIPAILFYIFSYSNNIKIKRYIFFLIPFIIPLMMLVIKIIVITKINTSVNSSYSLRMDDVFAGLTAWKQHLFIGNGLGNSDPIIQHIQPWRLNVPGGTGLSPGLTTELAYGGIILMFIYLLPMILASKNSKKIFYFSVCLILLFLVEDISGYYIFIIIISYFWIIFLFHNH